MTQSRTPDMMPVLSRGKHRKPRKGACFMELASYLAGEPWSDHPACTHPLLAALARDVNDHVSDAARGRLAPLIPDVIGLTTDDPRVDVWIARDAALTALPIVSARHQNTVAVGLLRCERVLAEMEGRRPGYLSDASAEALDDVPRARDWARNFTGLGWGRSDGFNRESGPAIVHTAVAGIATACVDDPDAILVDLLERTIRACADWTRPEVAAVAEERWRDMCALTVR
jgi:hypothetical protein